MADTSRLGTHEKVLAINIDARKYGTFAEIGAGQEVVRWFFKVGGASSTVAKSMSAYDMTVSDAIYGKSERYVSRQRLLQMLDHEFQLNVERLKNSPKHLFAFADTVSARNFRGTNQCHGWMGLRFQHQAGANPSQILIHVRMLDKENLLQQEALGIVGVNLIYGAFYHVDNPALIIRSLLDNLSPDRIEVDMAECMGPAFVGVDNRLIALQLVSDRLSEVAMFDCDGQVLQPADVLYKRPVILERGSFRPVTLTHIDIIRSAYEMYSNDLGEKAERIKVLLEMTMTNLLDATSADTSDFLARADVLGMLGQPVLITKFSEYYRIVGYLAQSTQEQIALAIGAGALREIFEPKYYDHLEGKVLEGLGKLFRPNVKAYVYPQIQPDGTTLAVNNFEPVAHLREIYRYLVAQQSIVPIQQHELEYSSIASKDVMQMLQSGDPKWEKLVPLKVAELIKERGLFGYKPRQ